ncbi:MAG: DUF3991 domain-containing protein [Clostridiales bacterium]|nr:DUF3991 domain-containing protein [Clostridiales bacterium]
MAIEDFGEKIGGARKDLYGLNRELRLDDIKEWSDIDRDKYITKKEVFPLPDYQRLYEGGMDREVLFFVKQVRDALPTRPFPHIRYNMTSEEKQEAVHQAQDDYIRTMGRFYETAIHLSSLTECADYLNNLKAENLPDKNCFSQKLYNVASIGDPYTLMQFRHQLEKKKFLYSDDEKALLDYDIFSYDGTNVEVTRDRKDEPILVIKQGGTRFYVYRNSPEILDLANWKENTYFVMDKSTHTIVTMNEPNRSSAEASAIALHKQKDVTVREQKKRKKKLIPPQLEKVRPTQEDYREGRNITGDDMMEIFGFRAGEFGNWENESDRQTNLNMSYDALKDLAKALNMSDQDVSLGGKLAIAYGARGVSGALAHFEPGTNVINLTKMRGAGSLAHEWGHALDYYIAQTTGKGEVFATDAWNGMSYMHDVMQTIKYKDGKRTEYYNNAVRLDERYSKAGQGYWQSDVELFARAFASYIHDKLSGPSDYLVGHSEIKVPILVKDEQQWIYTSPQGEERKAINQAMDEMIDAIKEHGLLHQGREKNVEAPKMTMDEYLGSQGVGFPTSGYVLDKVRFPNGISKRMHQQINDEFEKTEQEYADRRKEARREYQEKVDNGEIIPKTKEEINIERAQGDPNKESTQAARRLLVKRGIMTEEELSTNVKVWDKKWTKMTEANGSDIVQKTEILSDQELFTQQVDDVLAGVANQYNALKVCDTPQLLIEVGCKQLPMLITQKHLRDSLKPLSKSNSKWHGLTEQQIKKLPELIADPVMIYDSQTLKNSLVVVTSEIDSRNFPIIVSIKANGQGTYELQKIDSNFITSVYGRRNFAGHITDVVNKGDLLYWNKQKSQELFRVSRLQLPGCLNNLNFDIILHQSKSIVNTQLVEATVKQKKYAQQIAQALHVDLPQSNTKQAYQDFIKEHVEEYNQNRSVPVHYTDEQIARANAVDIVEYARSQGLELKRAGRDYRVSNYSGGFLITPEKNNWNWFAENKGGGVVQLCMELENKTWQDAIGTLIQEDMVAIQRSDLQNRQPEKPKEFHLPDHNNTTKHVYAYLTKTRKIDADIVKQMFGRKLLYENTQCSCVFVGYDKDGIPRHASVRSTNTTGNVYKKDVSGSQKKYSFSVTGKTNVLNVFEAPIDALSYMTLQKMNGRMPQDSYVALGGVSMTALDQYVKDHPDIRAIRICTDNDEAGQRAAEHIAEKYSDQYKVTRHTPKTKDFNEDLVETVNAKVPSTNLNPNADKYNRFVEQHRRLIQDKKVQYQNRTTVVINAFGGAGAGKTVACMDVCQQLKKRGYNAEYVSEYCKELVYENSDMLSGTPDNQFEILKEQMRRMDRMIGQVDFIVTDSPILLNSVYNKALTPEYEQMVQELFRDYDNFTFFVARDTSHYQTEGRIHTLAESMEKDKQIKQMLHDNDIYFGTYNHETIDKIVDNASKTFKRLQERDQQISKYVDQEVAVTREKDVQSLSIEEKILYLSVLDTVYEQDYWKMIEDDIRNLTESEKTAYKNEYNQKRDECRLDNALIPKVGIAVALKDGSYVLQDVKVVDERLAEMIKLNPLQIDIGKMSVNGKTGDFILLKDNIMEPYQIYEICTDGLARVDEQTITKQCREDIPEQMLSSSFDIEMEQKCVRPLLENGVTLSSEIQQHYQKITRHFETDMPKKENLAAPEKKKGITFQLK